MLEAQDELWIVHYNLYDKDLPAVSTTPTCKMRNLKCIDLPNIIEFDFHRTSISENPHKLVKDFAVDLRNAILADQKLWTTMSDDAWEAHLPYSNQSRHFHHQCEGWTKYKSPFSWLGVWWTKPNPYAPNGYKFEPKLKD